MDYYVQGREFHPKYRMALWYNPQELFDRHSAPQDRFCLVWVENGTGIIRVAQGCIAFSAPSVFCFNERDPFQLEGAVGLTAHSLYFHPSLVNSTFDFENLRNGSNTFNQSDYDDTYLLGPFIKRSSEYAGFIHIGPAAVQRISALIRQIHGETQEQRDFFWPCRCRSFLLELLFLIRRSYDTAESSSMPFLRPSGGEMEKVILYLHANYQNKISLSGITKEFKINRTSLSEKFRETTGQSITGYLAQLRIHMACMMLRDTLLPVSEVLYRAGFTDRAHFNRTFGKLTGFTPNEYRKKYSPLAAG